MPGINELLSQQSNLVSQLQSLQGNANELLKARNESINASVDLGNQVAEQDSADTQHAIQAGQILARSLGADLNDPNYRLGKLSAIANEASDTANAARQKLTKIEATSFFDDPLGWLPNQFEADRLENAAAIQDKVQSNARDEMTRINNEVNAGFQTQKLINTNVEDSVIAKKLKYDGIMRQQAAMDLQLKGMNQQVEFTHAIMTGNNTLLSAYQHQQVMANETRRIAMADQSMKFEQLKWEHQLAREATQDEKDKWEQEYKIRNEARVDRAFEATQNQREFKNDIATRSIELAEGKFDAFQNNLDKREVERANKLITDQEKLADQKERLVASAKNADERLKLQKDAAEARDKVNSYKFNLYKTQKDAEQDNINNLAAAAKIAINQMGLSDRYKYIIDDNNPNNVMTSLGKLGSKKSGASATDIQTFQAIMSGIMKVGNPNLNPPGTQPLIPWGDTASEAANVIDINKPRMTKDEYSVYNKIIKPVLANVNTMFKGKAKTPERDIAIDEGVAAAWDSEAIKNPETNEFLKMPKLTNAVNFGRFKDSDFYAKYIKQDIETNHTDSSIEYIGDKAVKAIKDGMDFNSVAAAVNAFYLDGMAFNNHRYNFIKFGLAPQMQYFVPIDTPYGVKSVDMGTMTDVNTFLINKLSHTGFGTASESFDALLNSTGARKLVNIIPGSEAVTKSKFQKLQSEFNPNESIGQKE